TFTTARPVRADASACVGLVTTALDGAGALASNLSSFATNPECAAHADDPILIAVTGLPTLLDAAGVFADNPKACQDAIGGAITDGLVTFLAGAITDKSSPLYFFLQQVSQLAQDAGVQFQHGGNLQEELAYWATQIAKDPTVAKAAYDELSSIPGLDA